MCLFIRQFCPWKFWCDNIHDALDFTVYGLPRPWYPRHQTWEPLLCPALMLVTSGGHHYRPVQTCLLEGLPPQYRHLVTTKVCTVVQRVVRILLEFFLALAIFCNAGGGITSLDSLLESLLWITEGNQQEWMLRLFW